MECVSAFCQHVLMLTMNNSVENMISRMKSPIEAMIALFSTTRGALRREVKKNSR